MKRSCNIVFFFLFIGILPLSAQPAGNITINKDYRVDYLLDKHLSIAKYEQTIEGYRVQIFFDAGNNSQLNANNSRIEFMRRYPDTEAYIIFDSPYYKVRAGDFRSRLEAQHFLNSIFDNYPNAFIVLDKIKYPKLREESKEEPEETPEEENQE